MVSEVRDHWRCSDGLKRQMDAMIKEMVVGGGVSQDGLAYITELIRQFLTLIKD